MMEKTSVPYIWWPYCDIFWATFVWRIMYNTKIYIVTHYKSKYGT